MAFGSSSFAKHLPARCSFIYGNRKKFEVARSGLCGGFSKMSQWNCSRSKACLCRAVCGYALSCNRTIPRESLMALRQDNLRSHRPAENLAPHSRRDSQSAQPWPQLSLHLPCDKVRRTTAWGNFSTSHWTPETNDRLQQNRCANILYFLDDLRIFKCLNTHARELSSSFSSLPFLLLYLLYLQLKRYFVQNVKITFLGQTVCSFYYIYIT